MEPTHVAEYYYERTSYSSNIKNKNKNKNNLIPCMFVVDWAVLED